VDQLETIRVPAAVPSWLASTTHWECGRILRVAPGGRDAGHVQGAEAIPDDHARTTKEGLLAAERHAALREAFTHLPPCC
jgi:hypothetical protein